MILVWAADGPHAIRSRSSSTITVQQLGMIWRPVLSGPAAIYQQQPSSAVKTLGGRSQGGGAGSNPVGATPLHPPVSGGWSYFQGSHELGFARSWSAAGPQAECSQFRIGPSSKIILRCGRLTSAPPPRSPDLLADAERQWIAMVADGSPAP
jgi:hypothetical protein